MVMITKEPPAAAVEEGMYTAKLESVEEQAGKFGAYFRWTYKIIDPEGEFDGRTVNGQTTTKWEAEGKLDKLITGFGVEAEIGADFDINDLVGRKVQVMIQNKTQGDKEFSNVVSVKPIKKKAQATGEASKDKPAAKPTEEAAKPKPTAKVKDDFNFEE